MTTVRFCSHALIAGVLALGPRAVRAQDPRLDRRLDPETRAAVVAILDSARAAGLPTEPLVDKALEGASKGAAGSRIVAAVRNLAAGLRAAQAALGPGSTAAELDAAASAMRGGVQGVDLARLRDAHRRRDLTVPLAVLSDLVARGVPADTAARFVMRLAAVAQDDAFVAFQRDVDRDIALGAPALAAASVRVNITVRDLAGTTPPPTVPRKP